MAQIIDPVPSNTPDRILCCYVNATSKIQVARITNVPNWYFERVVFPGQRLIFEAISSAQLEIHCGMMASAILSDTIPCERLRIAKERDAFADDSDSDSGDDSSDSSDAHATNYRSESRSFRASTSAVKSLVGAIAQRA